MAQESGEERGVTVKLSFMDKLAMAINNNPGVVNAVAGLISFAGAAAGPFAPVIGGVCAVATKVTKMAAAFRVQEINRRQEAADKKAADNEELELSRQRQQGIDKSSEIGLGPRDGGYLNIGPDGDYGGKVSEESAGYLEILVDDNLSENKFSNKEKSDMAYALASMLRAKDSKKWFAQSDDSDRVAMLLFVKQAILTFSVSLRDSVKNNGVVLDIDIDV